MTPRNAMAAAPTGSEDRGSSVRSPATVATDVERRFSEHSGTQGKGAKCLRGKGPLRLAYQVCIGSRSLALRAEYAFKQWGKPRKEQWLRGAAGVEALLEALELEPDHPLSNESAPSS